MITSAGLPLVTKVPFFITTTWWANCTAWFKSWSTSATVSFSSRFNRSSSFMTSSWWQISALPFAAGQRLQDAVLVGHQAGFLQRPLNTLLIFLCCLAEETAVGETTHGNQIPYCHIGRGLGRLGQDGQFLRKFFVAEVPHVPVQQRNLPGRNGIDPADGFQRSALAAAVRPDDGGNLPIWNFRIHVLYNRFS